MNEFDNGPKVVNLNNKPTLSNGKVSGAEIRAAMKSLAPMLKMARERVSQLPTSPVVNEETGETEDRQFVSHAQLARILFQTCGGRLIVHPKIINFGTQCEVVSELMLLTTSGYIMIDSGRASANAATAMPKVLLEAESRSKRNALSILRVFCADDITDEMNEKVDSHTEQMSSLAEISPKEKKSSKRPKAVRIADATSTKKTTKVDAQEQLALVDDLPVEKTLPKAGKTSLTRQGKNLEPVAKWPDKKDVRYREMILDGIKSVKDSAYKNMSMAKFIKQVVGERGVNRLNSCGMPDLEKLFENYVINKDCPI
jgi:hypothetical protein